MRKNLRKKIITCAGIFFGAVMLAATSFVPGMAAETEMISFQTEKKVKDAADGYFVLQDETTQKYGLFDGEGKNIIPCEYDEMNFPEDTILYDYVVVKKGSNWGILDYTGKSLIEVKYSSVSPYADGRKIATAYDGDKTKVFNNRGKQIGNISGEYTPVSDDVFKGETDLRTRKNVAIFSLANQKLLFHRKNTELQVANVYQLGNNIVADYNVGSSQDSSREMYGKIDTYRYIKVFRTSGEDVELMKVTPDPAWTEKEKETVRGGIRVEKVVSDHSFVVRLMGYKENYLAIYDINKKAYSQFFLNIGDFYNGQAFAADEEGKLYIIDVNGEKVSENEVKVTGYNRLGVKKSKHDPFMIFKNEENGVSYRLYSLQKNMVANDSFTTVTFRKNAEYEDISHGFPLVSNAEYQYTILNYDGNPIFDYGLYDKNTLVNHTFYSDTYVTMVVEENNVQKIYSYKLAESAEKSIFDKLEDSTQILKIIGSAVGIGVLIIFVMGILRWRKRRRVVKSLRRRRVDRRYREMIQKIEESETESEEIEKEETGKNNTEITEIKLAVNQKEPPVEVVKTKVFGGQLNCLTGEYAGSKIPMEEQEWIQIGRDDSENDLVMNKGTISRKHCAVHYDRNRQAYCVIDYSRNGVFLEDGNRLPQNEEVLIKPGSKIYLGDNRTIIELAADPLV